MPGVPNYGISEGELKAWIEADLEVGGIAMTASWYSLKAAGYRCSERRFAKAWKHYGGKVRGYYYVDGQ